MEKLRERVFRVTPQPKIETRRNIRKRGLVTLPWSKEVLVYSTACPWIQDSSQERNNIWPIWLVAMLLQTLQVETSNREFHVVHGKLLLRRKRARRPSVESRSRKSSLTAKWRRTAKGCAGCARRICSSTSNSRGGGGGGGGGVGGVGRGGLDGTAGFWRPRAVMRSMDRGFLNLSKAKPSEDEPPQRTTLQGKTRKKLESTNLVPNGYKRFIAGIE